MNMNIYREALRHILTTDRNDHQISKLTRRSHHTIKRYRTIANSNALTWSDVSKLDDRQIQDLLTKRIRYSSQKRMPDWSYIRTQMQIPNVTRMLLWEEYCMDNPDSAYSYSAFTESYRDYLSQVDVTMRQTHRAGESVFVDFAGTRIPYFKTDGTKHFAEVFVGVLGASRYTFACACESQKLPDWLDVHNQMFHFFGGVSKTIVPDNLKSAVTCPGSEPKLNLSYQELAVHYGTVIVPARVARPQDKSHGEIGVQIVTRWITASLRHLKFFSLNEINNEIAKRLTKLNERPFKKLPGCRQELFEQLDKPHLNPLPINIYEPSARWVSKQKVRSDYHIHIEHHYYSVPYQLVGLTVEARVTHKTVELFCNGKRVASHVRSDEQGGSTTLSEHQPIAHRKYAEQTPDYFKSWAQTIGEATTSFVEYQFNRVHHYLPGLRVCNSLRKLASIYGEDRLEAACQRAGLIGSLTLKSVQSILKNNRDRIHESEAPVQGQLPMHYNVRGAAYYAQEV
jgi:transposase